MKPSFKIIYLITMPAPTFGPVGVVPVHATGGASAANTIIQATVNSNKATYHVFELDGGDLTPGNLTVRNGNCTDSCDSAPHIGGGIYNSGTLAITNVTFSGNLASQWDGGMFNISKQLQTNISK